MPPLPHRWPCRTRRRSTAWRGIQDPAWEEVPFLPLGECKQPPVYRTAITGILDGTAVFWNVRPA